ncbi:hypothetical protein HDV06_002535 [Boothiomyces sp. JEL0866]|nr:hypothetical protein HDV06_002535 [Boothiomyces sp. JEL0866]
MTKTAIKLNVQNHLIEINEKILDALPKDSCLYKILVPPDNFGQCLDSSGNAILQNCEIKPKTIQIILDFLQSNDIVQFLVQSAENRLQIVHAMEYFGLEIPQEMEYGNRFARISEQGLQANIRDYDAYRELILESFLPTAIKISNKILDNLQSKFAELKPSPELVSCNNFIFEVYVRAYDKVQISLKYKKELAEATFEIENQNHHSLVHLCLFYADIFLNVLWGLDIPKSKLEHSQVDSSKYGPRMRYEVPASSFSLTWND